MKQLEVEVFISDFHAKRVEVVFNWILNLSPSLLPNIKLIIHEVSSEGIFTKNDFEERMKHERNGILKIQENQKKIQTIQSFYQFLFLGGHYGLNSYLHGHPEKISTKVGYK